MRLHWTIDYLVDNAHLPAPVTWGWPTNEIDYRHRLQLWLEENAPRLGGIEWVGRIDAAWRQTQFRARLKKENKNYCSYSISAKSTKLLAKMAKANGTTVHETLDTLIAEVAAERGIKAKSKNQSPQTAGNPRPNPSDFATKPAQPQQPSISAPSLRGRYLPELSPQIQLPTGIDGGSTTAATAEDLIDSGEVTELEQLACRDEQCPDIDAPTSCGELACDEGAAYDAKPTNNDALARIGETACYADMLSSPEPPGITTPSAEELASTEEEPIDRDGVEETEQSASGEEAVHAKELECAEAPQDGGEPHSAETHRESSNAAAMAEESVYEQEAVSTNEEASADARERTTTNPTQSAEPVRLIQLKRRPIRFRSIKTL